MRQLNLYANPACVGCFVLGLLGVRCGISPGREPLSASPRANPHHCTAGTWHCLTHTSFLVAYLWHYVSPLKLLGNQIIHKNIFSFNFFFNEQTKYLTAKNNFESISTLYFSERREHVSFYRIKIHETTAKTSIYSICYTTKHNLRSRIPSENMCLAL